MSVAYNDSRIPVRDRRTGVLGAAVGFFHLLRSQHRGRNRL